MAVVVALEEEVSVADGVASAASPAETVGGVDTWPATGSPPLEADLSKY